MTNLNTSTSQQWEIFLFQDQNYSSDKKTSEIIESLLDLIFQQFKQITKEKLFAAEGLITEDKLKEIIDLVPILINELGIQARPYSSICRSCIIPNTDITKAVQQLIVKLFPPKQLLSLEESGEISLTHILCQEFLFILPSILNQQGFELFKPAEQEFINDRMAAKLARAIHSQYSKQMRDITQNSDAKKIYGDLYLVEDTNQQYFNKSYDELSDSIKQSNIDNAYHIPTKLLAIGYGIRERNANENVPLLYLSEDEVETMAMVEHDRWSWEKRLSGFRFSKIRDDKQKKHNCLIPYEHLSELEKEKDRVLVRLIPALLQDIGFIPYALNPELVNSIHYPQLALAKIHHVKRNAEELTEGIQKFLTKHQLELPLEFKNLLDEIVDGTQQLAGAITSAGTVQRTYLPTPLYLRECLPDCFLLFKPKDIVSGDFYFVSKKFGAVVLIAADCTGHGIQGALLSAICYNYIDQAVNDKNITDPAAIIATVMPRVEYLMRRSEGNVENKSGMELAVCTFYPESNLLFYAGLNRPLYYHSDGQLQELAPTRYRDNFDLVSLSIRTQIVQMAPGDTAYIFSDGFVDQIGGTEAKNGKKFKTIRFKELLSNIQHQDMVKQRETLNQTIEKWRQQAKQEQIDDIIVIGVKL